MTELRQFLKSFITLKINQEIKCFMTKHSLIERIKTIAYDNYYEGSTTDNEIILKRVNNSFFIKRKDNIKFKIRIEENQGSTVAKIEYTFPMATAFMLLILRVFLITAIIISVYFMLVNGNSSASSYIWLFMLLIPYALFFQKLHESKRKFSTLLSENFQKWEIQY